MPLPRTSGAALLLAAAVAAACGPLPASSGSARKATARPATTVAGTASRLPEPAIRTVPQLSTQVVTLVGKAKLLSDAGGGLVSDQGAAIVSNNSGALVGNQGGALV
ncbi:MAG: hypothetical protein VKS61_18105, partial [Candidatus Sericytochromatia bacterium]|nr:hypothetical protein [Candidatus Sericytochromatia bacterium]